MNLFSRIFGKQAKDEAVRREIIKKLDGRAIKYVTERVPKPGAADDSVEEIVIGRSGALIVKEGILISSPTATCFFPRDDTLKPRSCKAEGVILTARILSTIAGPHACGLLTYFMK